MNLPEDKIKNQRLVALFLFSCVLLNYPFIGIFNSVSYVAGVPIMFLYLFLIWLSMIIMLFYINEISRMSRDADENDARDKML